jgi:hypothetical protein
MGMDKRLPTLLLFANGPWSRIMYKVDEHDKVIPLVGIPASSTGAPLPIVLANERALLLAYYTEIPCPSWNGTNPRSISADTMEDPVAVLNFGMARAHYLGSPNDEAFLGHPLATRGLSPYGAFEVSDSSWIRTLMQMNSVHPRHNPAMFKPLRHFIFSFHDKTFECIAKNFDVTILQGPIMKVVAEVQQWLFA